MRLLSPRSPPIPPIPPMPPLPPPPDCTPDPNCPYEAVFQSTSGGNDLTLYYNPDMDDILFDFDLVHCQAQGNHGIETNLEYSRSSHPQAWAKNTISVGGVKHFNNRDSSLHRWCGGWDACGGTLSEACTSIGPAADGRVKPDLAGFFDCIQTVDCCPYRPHCSFCVSAHQDHKARQPRSG